MKLSRIAILAAMCATGVIAVGCGSGSEPAIDVLDDATLDATPDLLTPDANEDVVLLDHSWDTNPDTQIDTTPDSETELPTDDGTPDVAPEVFSCGTYDEWPSQDDGQTKFGLTMFHWNIQYVPGGLVLEYNGETISICADMGLTHEDCKGLDDEALTDWIIRISFLPILDLYLAHPTWRATFEMPGLMVQAIAEKHPDVFAKLQCAANSGQIELVSIHWSDQLFLAFPSRDLKWSIEHNRKVFEAAALPLSGVVFNQEGQSGVGKHRIMAENGYTIDVMHRNLYKYHQKGDTEDGVWPVYESTGPGAPGSVKVVVGGSVDPTAGVDVDWTFFDDGEVLATPGNPYLAMVTPEPDMKAVGKFEKELQEKADDGYYHTTIADYVSRLEKLGIAPKPILPFADSTWQPPSTEGISRWMGRMGTIGYSVKESDNAMRIENYRASTCLAAADVALDLAAADSIDVTADRDLLDDGYLSIIKAEVSDATGINPWFGEWAYGAIHNADALDKCQQVIDSVLDKMGKQWLTVDIDTRTALQDGEYGPLFQFSPTPEAEIPISLDVQMTERPVNVDWRDDGRVYQLTLEIGASADQTGDVREQRTVTMTIPMTIDSLIYTPGLIEDHVVEIPFADFDLFDDQIYVPLANGLIGVGPDLWIIKSCRSVHLAARVAWDGTHATLQFIDETVEPAEQLPRTFFVLKGTSEEALAFARLINTHPNYILQHSSVR